MILVLVYGVYSRQAQNQLGSLYFLCYLKNYFPLRNEQIRGDQENLIPSFKKKEHLMANTLYKKYKK